ncbi:MAG: sialate O-acetylesterase [Bacteroidia bacterium]|nr:sialate O-acetylesterase [Bacteroidia bacterium]
MPKFSRIVSYTGFFLSLSMGYGQSGLRLPRIFSDHMVLQRGMEVPIWGWAKANEEVVLTFGKTEVKSRTNDQGKWELKLPPQQAGGPHSLVISSKKKSISLEDVWFGELWLCGGQSNMQYDLKTLKKDSAIAQSTNPQIRLFQVPRGLSFQPNEDLPYGEWQSCSPTTSGEFSAVAYFFGQKLHEELNVPIGLISSNYGGSVLETWLSKEAALGVPYYKEAVESLQFTEPKDTKRDVKRAYRFLRKSMGKLGEKATGLSSIQPKWAQPSYDDQSWGKIQIPGLWDEQGLNELDGTIWCRKEFELKNIEEDEDYLLSFSRVDDRALVFLNGQLLKEVELELKNNEIKAQLPRFLLKEGRNVICLKITDTGGPGGVWGPDSLLYIKGKQQRIDLAGEWKYRLDNRDIKLDIPGDKPNDMPTLLHNSMIHPLGPMAIRGAIWYQGESNADRGAEYQRLFKLLVMDWRRQFRREISFHFVQLANFKPNWYSANNSSWAELREAQRQSLDIAKTGMAVAIDIGEAYDIHPKNKEDVGLRLALNALALDYDMEIVYQGPMYQSLAIKEEGIMLSFSSTGTGLKSLDGKAINGFLIAGEDKKFKEAEAYIKGHQLLVYSKEVKNPVAIRYAWKDNPQGLNLVNSVNLPASPFRTDDWPLDSKDRIKVYYPFKH